GDDRSRGEAMLTTNLLGTYGTFHVAGPKLAARGRLIAMSRSGGGLGGASEGGLVGLVRSIAPELFERKITCNAIVLGAGAIETEVTDLVVHLCSSSAAGITGQSIAIG